MLKRRKMKVVILTEGGNKIGFGHISRCIALCQAIEKEGYNPELMINADNNVSDFVKERNCQIFNWLAEQKKVIRLLEDASLVIIDSYLAEKPFYDRISQMTNGNLLMIDDCNRLDYPRGIVLNPSIYGDKLNYPSKEGVTYLFGKDYIILRKEFWEVPKKKINKEIKNILITIGRGQNSNLIDKIIDSLKDCHEFNFEVAGSNGGKLSAQQMLDLMLKADISISGGGQTTYELARVGVPTIGICFAENQRMNLEEWERQGFVSFAGFSSYPRIIEEIKKSLYSFDREKRKKTALVGKNAVDGKGAERLLKIIGNKIIFKEAYV